MQVEVSHDDLLCLSPSLHRCPEHWEGTTCWFQKRDRVVHVVDNDLFVLFFAPA
jgi:hypothetical protein